MPKSKRSRGPKPSCPWDKQLEELSNHDIFYADENVKEEEKFLGMWNLICKNLRKQGYKITPHTIQNNVAQNRHELRDDLLKLKKKQNNDVLHVSVEKPLELLPFDDYEAIQKLHLDALLKPLLKGYSPYLFNLSFWSKDAIKLAKLLKSELVCIFGAVGNFTENFVLRDKYESQQILSYCLGTSTDKIPFAPLAHTLSEKDTKAALKKFFLEVVRSGFPTPLRITIEFRESHLHAVTEALNTNFSYEKYLTTGYQYLKNEDYKKNLESSKQRKTLQLPKEKKHISVLDGCSEDIEGSESKQIIALPQVEKLSNTTECPNIALPKCQIIVDLQSVVNHVKCWPFGPPDLVECLRDFFVNVIRVLHNQTSLHNFERILKEVLVMTMSQFQSEVTKSSFDNLRIEITKLPCNELEKITVYESSMNVKIDQDMCVDLIEYLQNIRRDAQNIVSNDTSGLKNSFYSTTTTEKILDLCIHFITWTKVLDNSYKSKSRVLTTDVLQEYRNEFLATLPDSTLKIRVADYVKRAITFTEDKIFHSLNNLQIDSKDQTINSSNIDHPHKNDNEPVDLEEDKSFLSYAENWGGIQNSDCESKSSSSESESSDSEVSSDVDEHKSHQLLHPNQLNKKSEKSAEPKKRGLTLEADPDFFLFKQLPKTIRKKRSVIRNANDRPDVLVEKSSISFITTSEFDSIFEILISSFYLINQFQKLVKKYSSTNSFFGFINDYATQLKLKKPFYDKRAEFLMNVMQQNQESQNKFYWKDNLSSFITEIVAPSIKRSINCNSCNKNVPDDGSILQMNFADVVDKFNNVDTPISLPSRYCTFCGHEEKVELNVSHYFFVDVEQCDKNKTLQDINTLPLDIAIGGKRFALTGVISYRESESDIKPRHYVANCLKPSKTKDGTRVWAVFDDSLSRIETLKDRNAMVQPSILVFIEYEAPIKKVIPLNENVELLDLVPAVPNDESHKKNSQGVSEQSVVIGTTEPMDWSDNNSLTEICCEVTLPLSSSTPDSKKSSKNILTIDKANAKLNDEEKDETEFSFNDINCATLTWEHPPMTTKIICNAGNQEQIIFQLDQTTLVLQFTNTCPFDSIVEAIKHCYKSNTGMSNDIEKFKHRNIYLQAVSDFSRNQDLHALYFFRAKAMFIKVPTKVSQQRGREILLKDCRMNVCTLFETMMHGYPAITTNGTCEACKTTQDRAEYTKSISFVSFFEKGLSCIGVELRNDLLQKKMYCLNEKCGKQITKINIGLASYIAVDLEFMYETLNEETIQTYTTKAKKNFKTKLNDIPTSITLYNQTYNLKAVIAFKELILKPKPFLHYLAFCRSHSNNEDHWVKYDDTENDAQKLPANKLPQIKIALLLYTFAGNDICH